MQWNMEPAQGLKYGQANFFPIYASNLVNTSPMKLQNGRKVNVYSLKLLKQSWLQF